MRKNILQILLIVITASWFVQCTPAKNTVTEPEVKDAVYTINLWTMSGDTFISADSSSVLKVYADVQKDAQIISDSTAVRFYASFGKITDKSFTEGGQAVASYSAYVDSITNLSGNLQIRASFTGGGKIIYDTLNVLVTNPLFLTKKIK